MTDLEYEILDELYFVISYKKLCESITLSNGQLRSVIDSLHKKGWLRVFESPDNTMDYEKFSDEMLMNSYLLASKEGLKAHNSV